MTSLDPKALIGLLQDIRGLLAYHRSLGISHYRRTPALESFLRGQPPPPSAGPVHPDGAPVAGPEKNPPVAQAASMPAMSLADLRAAIGSCRRCRLHESRHQIVAGRGRGSAPLLFLVGDSPAEEDDCSGDAFSGPAGELLSKMLAAINLGSAEVYVTNLVKCRPPDERPPTTEELASCLPFLLQEIEAAVPRIICAMGPLAARMLLKTEESFFRLRGRFHDLPGRSGAGIAVMPTFHPAFLIRNPEMKKTSWQDLQLIARRLKAPG